jgi:hypothetical protein
MKTLIGLVVGVGLATLVVGSADAMTCSPFEVAVKTKVDFVDVNGNIVVNGTPGCAQSATAEGRVRVLIQRVDMTGGEAKTTVVQIDALPSEIAGR